VTKKEERLRLAAEKRAQREREKAEEKARKEAARAAREAERERKKNAPTVRAIEDAGLFVANPDLMAVARYGGAAFLVWYGARALLSALRGGRALAGQHGQTGVVKVSGGVQAQQLGAIRADGRPVRGVQRLRGNHTVKNRRQGGVTGAEQPGFDRGHGRSCEWGDSLL
jgi:hypothetical protein